MIQVSDGNVLDQGGSSGDGERLNIFLRLI